MSDPKAIAVASGGMDSAVLVTKLLHEGYEVDVVSFNYGQSHEIELSYAHALYKYRLGLRHDIIDIRSVGKLLSSALTNPGAEIPEGHYAEENMKQTVVPNRNAIMMNIAIGLAVSRGAEVVGTGVHAGDHAVYPDCRPRFIDLLEELTHVANQGYIGRDFTIYAPFVHMTKREIASVGFRHGVPWHATWSCYKNGTIHCGRCGTCVERIEALQGYEDNTLYADTTFWKEHV